MTDDYQADTDAQKAIAQKFYTKDYAQKWPGLTLQRAKQVGDEIGVDWEVVDLGQFIEGIKEEMEHGSEYGSATKVHDDDYVTSGRIAYAHLIERPDYYTALSMLEDEGDAKFNDSDEAKKKWVADQRAAYQNIWDSVT